MTSPTCAAGTGPPSGASLQRRLRPRLRLRGARPDRRSSTSCRAGTTCATTSTAAASRTARACCARCSRTRSRRSTAGRRSPAGSRSTSCSATTGIERGRDRGACFGARRRAARPVGLHRRRLGGRLAHVALRPRGAARSSTSAGSSSSPPSPSSASAGSPRPTRWCGGPRRRARPDRRRPAVDRRPVPAAEDRGGPARGHPRVHRLQHLRLGRLDDDADPLHPEPDHGRGVAPRLASRADPAARRPTRACSWSAPARPGSRRRCRSARAATRRPGRGDRELGGRVAREARLPGLAAWIRVARLPPRPARAAARTSRSPTRARVDRRRGARVRLRPRRRRDGCALARPTASAAGTRAPLDLDGRPRC